MTRAEKMLYHQIHPLKLATDYASGLGSCVLVWQHRLGTAMLLAFLPAIAASLLLMAFVNLEPYNASALGRYVRSNMTRAVEAQRMTGQIVIWVGAWLREPLVMGLGFAVIMLAWLSGVGRPRVESTLT